VRFVKAKDKYLFQIRDFVIKNSRLILESGSGETIDVEKASVQIKGLGLDPASGLRFDRLGVQGVLRKGREYSGSFRFNYDQTLKGDVSKTEFDLSARDIDLAAIRFIYKDSLPVDFNKGSITVTSRTDIVNGALDSNNSFVLKGHSLFPKNKGQMIGVVPLSIICDALNKIDPFEMKFRVEGTVDAPHFKGFEDALLSAVKPYIANVTKDIKKQGLKAITDMFKKEESSARETSSSREDTASKAIESLKSLFGGKDQN